LLLSALLQLTSSNGLLSPLAKCCQRSCFVFFRAGAQVRTQAGFSPALVSAIPDHPAGVSIPGVGLFNGRIAWENVMGTRFGVALYGKNLANKLYANSGLSLCESLGTITNTYGDPRTYGIEVSFRF